MDHQMPDVDCKYGAPMGRTSIGDKPTGPVKIFQMVLDEGGYDDGGAYWGTGEPIYCARGEEFERTTRAKNVRVARDWFQFQYGPMEFEPTSIEEDWLLVFLWAYVETALEDNDDEDGDQLSRSYTIEDVASKSFEQMRSDCLKFLEEAKPILELVERLEGVDMWSVPVGAKCSMIEYAGHHFWLTRTRSGAGFWDGDWPLFEGRDLGKELADIALKFSEDQYLYVHDGKVYVD